MQTQTTVRIRLTCNRKIGKDGKKAREIWWGGEGVKRPEGGEREREKEREREREEETQTQRKTKRYRDRQRQRKRGSSLYLLSFF